MTVSYFDCAGVIISRCRSFRYDMDNRDTVIGFHVPIMAHQRRTVQSCFLVSNPDLRGAINCAAWFLAFQTGNYELH